MWGASFLARLSGSTAEFLSIWLLAFAGPQPFALDADGAAIEDSLQVLVNQGEFFASSGIIFLQPDYVTRRRKPLARTTRCGADDRALPTTLERGRWPRSVKIKFNV